MRPLILGAVFAMSANADVSCAGQETGPSCQSAITTVRVLKAPRLSGERIVGLEFTVRGGSVPRVDRIPQDWGVLVQPEGGIASVRGHAGHGAGALSSANDLPSLAVRQSGCVGLSLTAIVHGTRDFESTRAIDLDQGALEVQPASNSTLQRSGARDARTGR
jgi:hypothetical protein